MKHIIAIGEALIDFAPEQTDVPIQLVQSFAPKVGGAPANVCGAVARLGGKSIMLTKLGDDPFGDKIISELAECGVNTDHILRSTKECTSLAFVALKEDGDREFSFIRRPGADMMYAPEEVPEEIFTDAYALHFCSVDLGDYPMREAHLRAIEYAKKAGVIVSFDPNLRPQLWETEEKLQQAIRDFIGSADIVKLSDDEVPFITGSADIQSALPHFWEQGTSLVICTMGGKGCCAFTEKTSITLPPNGIPAVDTTGAGDGFIGAFLCKLARMNATKEDIRQFTDAELKEVLRYAHVFCGQSIKRKGAIASYITAEELEQLL